MGNLLRVLYNRDDSPAKVDIFVDFESKLFLSFRNEVLPLGFMVSMLFVKDISNNLNFCPEMKTLVFNFLSKENSLDVIMIRKR